MDHYKLNEIFDPLTIEPHIVTRCSLEFKKQYSDWFLSYRWTRLFQLFNLIHSTSGFETWFGDFTPESLHDLNNFILKSIERVPMPEHEAHKRSLRFNSNNWTEKDYWVYTKKSFSIMFDIGIYFGEIFAIENDLHWELYRPGSRHLNSGCMVTNYLNEINFEVVISPISLIPKYLDDLFYKFSKPPTLFEFYYQINNLNSGQFKHIVPTKNNDLPDEMFSAHQNYRILKIFYNRQSAGGLLKDYSVYFKKKFYSWFQSHIETRTYQLNSLVKSTPGFETWAGGFTFDSLHLLNDFLNSKFANYNEENEFSEIQSSIIFDVGMYLGQTYVLNNCLHWEQYDPKSKSPDSGLMIIPFRKWSVNSDSNFFNPFTTVYNLAKKISKGINSETLPTIYNHYISLINTEDMELFGNPPTAIKPDL